MKMAVALLLIFGLLPVWLPIAIVLLSYAIAEEFTEHVGRWVLLIYREKR